MFRTSLPIAAPRFRDRAQALERLARLVADLAEGSPRWLAILGQRKIGKTSLLLEAARTLGRKDLRFVAFDVFDAMPPSLELFRRLAAHVLDAALAEEAGTSFTLLVDRPEEHRAALVATERFLRMPPALRSTLLELPTRRADEHLVRATLALPEQLGQALGLRFVVAIDEFQELATLGATARGAPDPLPLMRSIWQRHQRVAYVVSGSSRTMLTELVTSERSPFFQHFDLLELGPFDERDAVALLVEEAPRDRPIPAAIATRAYAILGGNPFYLQLLGETLTALDPPYDEGALKEALQSLLFSRSGRLSLYFAAEHQRIVGRSAGIAAVLDALAHGPRRPSEVGAVVRASSGATVRYLERLADTVQKLGDGTYAIDDRAFAAWLRWRAPGGSVVPMKLVGDEAEQRVAEHLAALGFELVYQSRGSRGAFDLLAVRGPRQLGIQVKRSALPLRFPRAAWDRMSADADRWGWSWCLAAVEPAGGVALLDPTRAYKRKEVRIGDTARIDNVLAWLDAR
ncbi:MAG: AAA family ATPase [Deltaproteobacteria bacterium]|nr:AAA family ATPase [Deltaproteobacteria bacterium]